MSEGGTVHHSANLPSYFVQLANALFRSRGVLTGNAVMVYGNIRSHTEGFKLSYARIQFDTGLGETAVRSAVKLLIELNLLQRRQAREADGTMGPSEWWTNDMAAFDITASGPQVPPVDNSPKQKRRSGPGTGDSNPDATSGNTRNTRSGPGTGDSNPDATSGDDAAPQVAPRTGDPHLADPDTKNTTPKNTTEEQPLTSGDQPHLPTVLAVDNDDSARGSGNPKRAALNVYVRGRLPECPRCERPYSGLTEGGTCRTCRDEIASQGTAQPDWLAA